MTKVAIPANVARRLAAGERPRVEVAGKVAVLVSVKDAELLERLDDVADLAAIRESLSEGGEPILWEKVKADLGL